MMDTLTIVVDLQTTNANGERQAPGLKVLQGTDNQEYVAELH